MKVLALAVTLLPLLALANPVAEAEAEPEPQRGDPDRLKKRAITCKMTGCDVRYHTKPDVNSPAIGEISGCNKKVSFSCYTTGSKVSGDIYWDKIASGAGNGYYVTEHFVDKNCAYGLPAC